MVLAHRVICGCLHGVDKPRPFSHAENGDSVFHLKTLSTAALATVADSLVRPREMPDETVGKAVLG